MSASYDGGVGISVPVTITRIGRSVIFNVGGVGGIPTDTSSSNIILSTIPARFVPTTNTGAPAYVAYVQVTGTPSGVRYESVAFIDSADGNLQISQADFTPFTGSPTNTLFSFQPFTFCYNLTF